MPASVALVIPTYNNLAQLRVTLRALAQQTFQDFVAYVCVDGSTDGTLDYLERYAPPFVRVLTHPDGRNKGRNAARNLILPHVAQHSWVAFLDSDSVPLPGWLEAFFTAKPTPQEVLLGAILYYAETNPHPWAAYQRWRERFRSQSTLTFKNFISVNALLPARAFLALDGMDPQIRRHGLGDTELGWRLQEAGYRFRYVPEARVWSDASLSLGAVIIRAYEMGRYNLPYVVQKHPGVVPHLFGGKWLYQPWRRVLLRTIFALTGTSRLLRSTPALPLGLQRWAVRYLLFQAVARGYWGLRPPVRLPDL